MQVNTQGRTHEQCRKQEALRYEHDQHRCGAVVGAHGDLLAPPDEEGYTFSRLSWVHVRYFLAAYSCYVGWHTCCMGN